MKHFGDITKLNGAELPIVDIITGGSPCQDLSVAGKRAGLDGERSGLFMEQIRIVKEMRNECARQLQLRGADEPIRPRYMVWENVPGAFSSNKGEDFRCVLEEISRIADKTATIPMPEKGKWSNSGCILGDGWSIAWRLHDAQFWGVPQRRKRIALVADFRGESAPEILFESESLSRDLEQSEQERKETSGDIGTGSSESDSAYTLKIRGGVDRDSNGKTAGKGALVQTEKSSTLGVSQDQTLIQCLNSWDVQSKHIQPQEGIAEALYSGECRGGGGESYVMQTSDGDIAGTLDASYYKGCGERQGIERTIVLEGNGQRDSHKGDGYKESEQMYTLNTVEQHAVCIGNGQYMQTGLHDKVGALNCMHDQQAVITYGLDRASFNQGKNALYDISIQEEIAQPIVARGPGGGTSETVGSLCARDYKGVGSQYVNEQKVIVQKAGTSSK